MRTRPRLLTLILSMAALVGFGSAMGEEPPRDLMVLASSSLKDALQELSDAYTKGTGQPVKLSFAESSALARQVEAGAAADVVIPADSESAMDYLEIHHLIDAESRCEFVTNQLVLIAPKKSPLKLDIAPGFALAAALGKGHLAIGNPKSVAAGIYTRYALISLGAWNSVEDRLAPMDSLPAVVAQVARGAAPLGIVYESDVLNRHDVRTVGVFPTTSHPRISYAVARTKPRADAKHYIDFLRSPQGQAIFHRYGFTPRR